MQEGDFCLAGNLVRSALNIREGCLGCCSDSDEPGAVEEELDIVDDILGPMS